VVIAPAAVQGGGAPAELVAALEALYALDPVVDAILLVRGGGSIEDLWAFNDETLAHTIVRSPVPVVSGVGHETDFTIADFVADLRAPTPTAAAELIAAPRDTWLGALDLVGRRLADGLDARLDTLGQRLDMAAARLGRPSNAVARQRVHLAHEAQRLRYAVTAQRVRLAQREQTLRATLTSAPTAGAARRRERLAQVAARLLLLDPARVLQRGYAWLADGEGRAITSVRQVATGEAISARLADGELPLRVGGPARSVPVSQDGD
jgi:exodeoxyribonuclease VII large subunit